MCLRRNTTSRQEIEKMQKYQALNIMGLASNQINIQLFSSMKNDVRACLLFQFKKVKKHVMHVQNKTPTFTGLILLKDPQLRMPTCRHPLPSPSYIRVHKIHLKPPSPNKSCPMGTNPRDESAMSRNIHLDKTDHISYSLMHLKLH